MKEQPVPVLRTIEEIPLIGTMAVYESQIEISERVPHQWREFRMSHPALRDHAGFYGASPCTGDRKIHYLTGVAEENRNSIMTGERLMLEAGEYAVVRVSDGSLLRETWTFLLESWLPASGRRERRAPEFEKFTDISEFGTPRGHVELWIPLEAPGSSDLARSNSF